MRKGIPRRDFNPFGTVGVVDLKGGPLSNVGEVTLVKKQSQNRLVTDRYNSL